MNWARHLGFQEFRVRRPPPALSSRRSSRCLRRRTFRSRSRRRPGRGERPDRGAAPFAAAAAATASAASAAPPRRSADSRRPRGATPRGPRSRGRGCGPTGADAARGSGRSRGDEAGHGVPCQVGPGQERVGPGELGQDPVQALAPNAARNVVRRVQRVLDTHSRAPGAAAAAAAGRTTCSDCSRRPRRRVGRGICFVRRRRPRGDGPRHCRRRRRRRRLADADDLRRRGGGAGWPEAI
jgi:hypothetical protein